MNQSQQQLDQGALGMSNPLGPLQLALDLDQFSIQGPPLFGLYPNGLFTFGLSLIGLQGYLDYHHLDYL